MSSRLKDKVAFITGGNSGIGLAAAKSFVAEGAQVALLVRNQAKADAALTEIGKNATAFIGDVTDLGSLQKAFEGVKSTYGRLDIVLASAGLAPITPLAAASSEDFDQVVNVNFKGAFFTVQSALPLLSEGASVILVSSSLNEMGMEGYSIYNASKAAIRSLARSFTPDLAKIGVRINVLSPGPIKTPVLTNAGLTDEQINAQYGVFDKVLAAGRAGEPEEMASVAVFLASSDSSFMYGAEIQADGGMNQTRWPKEL